jgi:hypothetical protein
MKGKQTE